MVFIKGFSDNISLSIALPCVERLLMLYVFNIFYPTFGMAKIQKIIETVLLLDELSDLFNKISFLYQP